MAEKTVQVRVQIIDIRPQVLDLRVPTFLRAGDLTQRIARDAGLQSHWSTRQRRLYWLRARGRLLGEEETLGSLGVIDNELVYLLPQPPIGMGVVEQNPDYPEVHDYAGKGLVLILATIIGAFVWAVCWGMALTQTQHWVVSAFPGLGLGVLSVSFARHAWGGRATQIRVFLSAFGLYSVALIPCIILTPLLVAEIGYGDFILALIPGFLAGLISVLLTWVAWWGAVEPLPPRPQVARQEEANAPQWFCGICNGQVADEMLVECPYNCGAVFHRGCYNAKKAVSRGAQNFCRICNQQTH